VSSVPWITASIALLLGAGAFLTYIHFKYAPIIGRIFEEKPLFLPLRAEASTDGEEVSFRTADDLTLVGTYLRHRAESRLGVVVFCHEYLGDRWSVAPYLDHLRDLGFDLFTFDFRNHGQSEPDRKYLPLQWVTDHEVNDLRAALDYVSSRSDADPAGVGLFGVSRGGGTALCVASKDARVWGVATDGAFPTRGTMSAYIERWAQIYVPQNLIWRHMPNEVYQFVAWTARKRSQSRLSCRYPDVEGAVARLGPRPLLMIHGAKDAYIGPQIAQGLFSLAGDPKEFWLVAKAKHNRSREVAGQAYSDRVASFFLANGPRTGPAPRYSPVLDFSAAAASSVPDSTIATLSPAGAGGSVMSR
jgi:pimeloyl-ACP methyl ester carboxylesterase